MKTFLLHLFFLLLATTTYCQATCSITNIALSNIICHDNHTPTVTSDDYMIFTIDPSGVNLGTTYDASAIVSVLGNTIPLPINQLDGSPATNIPYGSPVQLRTDAGSIASGLPIPFTVTVTDDADTGCTQTGSGTMPPFCSVPCDLTTIALSDIICHDNNTPTVTNDDYMIFTINPSGVSLGATYDAIASVSVLGNIIPLPITQLNGLPVTNIPYGSPVQLRTDAGSIASGLSIPFTVTVTDDGDTGCTQTGSGTMPPFCSSPPPTCTINVDFLGNPSACNDNGTPNDPSDDFFTQNIHASFFNRPSTGNLQLVPGGDQIGVYSIPVNQIVGNSHLFSAVQLKADGTPSVVQMNFTENTGCIDADTGPTVQPCSGSAVCEVIGFSFANIDPCNDNNTPSDASDDFFTVDVDLLYSNSVAGRVLRLTGADIVTMVSDNAAVGTNLTHSFTNVQLRATGQITNFMGQIGTTAAGFTEVCSSPGAGPAVGSCSSGGGTCSVNSINLQNIGSCNDNGSSDPIDDFFTANVLVTFSNPPNSGNMEIEPGGDAIGSYSVPVANLVGSSHTFTNVKFKADGTTTAIEVNFTANQGCVRTATAAAVQPCSFTPPVLTCPSAVLVSCANEAPAVNLGSVTETHNCPGTVTITHLNDVNSNVICINKLTITRTYQGTDQCGQVATCSQTITLNDQTPPVVVCPATLAISCASQVPAIDLNTLGVTDNCAGVVGITRTFVSEAISNQVCTNRFILTRIYRGGDACGNSATCSQTITVNDQTNPVITACPQNTTVSCASQVPPANLNSVTATDNCTGTITVFNFPADIISNQICANKFTVTRSYFVTDACGNSANCLQIITVNDQTGPVIVCPAPQTVACAEEVPAANPALVTGTDNCGGTITPSLFSNTISNQTCPNRFTLTRQYRAADACGNTSSCNQIITVNDQIAPTFTFVPASITVDCYLVPPVGIATASDNCTSGASVSFLGEVHTPGICPVLYTLTRTWRATDACGNSVTTTQLVTVTDTHAPQIIVQPQDKVVECGPTNASEFQNFLDSRAGLAAEDCAQITYSYEDSPVQNNAYNCGNTFRKNIRFIATDECGNSAFRDAAFTVVDLTPPVFSIPPQNLDIECDATDDHGENAFYDWIDSNAGLVAEDACGEVTLERVLVSEYQGCGNTWRKTYEFRAKDQCDNLSIRKATFAVVDLTPPAIACLPNDNIYLPCVEDVPAADPTAIEASDCNSVTVTLTNSWTVGTGCPNWPITLVYQYTATDGCGNAAVCERAYYVKETATPVLICPDTIPLPCVNDIPGPLHLFTYVKNLLAGNCEGSFTSIAIVGDSGQPQNGVTHRTYTITAKNHCGLVTSACTVTFLATGNCNQLCTASQGAWGDPNGMIGGMSTSSAIAELIQVYGPVTAGGGNHTVSAPDAACLQAMLFSSGSCTFLPSGHYTCPLPTSLANPDGSLNNQLAANAMALQLNIWYNLRFNNRNLGLQDLHTLPPCLAEFGLLKVLGEHSTVQDVLDLTNQYLQNYIGYFDPQLPALLNSALDNLNRFRTDCGLNAPCERPGIRSNHISSLASANRLFPNPTSGAAMLEFWTETDEVMLLKIADGRGALSVSNVTATKGLNTVEISLKNFPSGIYWVSLQGDKTVETLRLVKE